MFNKELGKGVSALFNDNSTGSDTNSQKTLRISDIEPNKNQPRTVFDEEAIATLANSIKEHGLLQPILVRPYKDGYQIVAGERRWRACRLLGMTEIPAIISEMSDIEVAQAAIVENLQRENLNPIEEAEGFKELAEKYGMTQEEIAVKVGRSRSAVTNALRLLSLPQDIIKMVSDGQVSVGQAKAILAVSDVDTQLMLAKQCADGLLTVRDIEKFTQKQNAPKKVPIKKAKDNYLTEMQLALTHSLGRKVKVEPKGKKILLSIECFSNEELSDFADKLTK